MCEGCAAEGSAGSCVASAAETDPDDECGLATCDGAGACLFGEHVWSDVYLGSAAETVSAVAFDSAGNMFIAGTFAGSTTIDGQVLIGTGGEDAFLAKLSPSGQRIWAKGYGRSTNSSSNTNQTITDIAVTGSGDVIVVGSFTRDISGSTFAGINFGNAQLETNDGLGNTFAAAIDGTTGNHVWSKAQFGNYEYNQVEVDASGNIYVAADGIGDITIDGFTHPSAGAFIDRIVLLKMNASGLRLTSVASTGDGDAQSRGLAVLTDGSVALAARFTTTHAFGGPSVTSASSFDVVAIRYQNSLNHLWTRGFGGTGADDVGGLAATVGGGVVLTGEVRASIDFGGGEITAAGGDDLFVAKLDANGDHLWSHVFGDNAEQSGLAIVVDDADHITVGGFFLGGVDFGGGTRVATLRDGFLCKFSDSGDYLWDFVLSGASDQSIETLTVGTAGQIGIGAIVDGTISFGAGTLTGGSDEVATAVLGP